MADDTSAASRLAGAGRRWVAAHCRGSRGWGTDPRVADHRRGRREPQPLRRQRCAAVDRRGVRRFPDIAGPGRRRLLAGPRRIGPLAGCHRRPIRPQDAAPPRRRALHPGVSAGGVRTEHRGADRGAHRRRRLRRHGVPDHPGADHGTVGAGARTDALDRPLVGPRRRDRGAWAARVRLPARELRVGIGLPRHAAARGRRPLHGLAVRAGARQRDDRPGRQPRRDPVRRAGRDADPGHQLRARPEHGGAGDRPGGHLHRGDRRVRHPPATRPRIPCTTSTSRPGRRSGSPPWRGSSSSDR